MGKKARKRQINQLQGTVDALRRSEYDTFRRLESGEERQGLIMERQRVQSAETIDIKRSLQALTDRLTRFGEAIEVRNTRRGVTWDEYVAFRDSTAATLATIEDKLQTWGQDQDGHNYRLSERIEATIAAHTTFSQIVVQQDKTIEALSEKIDVLQGRLDRQIMECAQGRAIGSDRQVTRDQIDALKWDGAVPIPTWSDGSTYADNVEAGYRTVTGVLATGDAEMGEEVTVIVSGNDNPKCYRCGLEGNDDDPLYKAAGNWWHDSHLPSPDPNQWTPFEEDAYEAATGQPAPAAHPTPKRPTPNEDMHISEERLAMLYASPTADVWAREFVQFGMACDWTFDMPDFEGTMIGWFANAMGTAIDHHDNGDRDRAINTLDNLLKVAMKLLEDVSNNEGGRHVHGWMVAYRGLTESYATDWLGG